MIITGIFFCTTFIFSLLLANKVSVCEKLKDQIDRYKDCKIIYDNFDNLDISLYEKFPELFKDMFKYKYRSALFHSLLLSFSEKDIKKFLLNLSPKDPKVINEILEKDFNINTQENRNAYFLKQIKDIGEDGFYHNIETSLKSASSNFFSGLYCNKIEEELKREAKNVNMLAKSILDKKHYIDDIK